MAKAKSALLPGLSEQRNAEIVRLHVEEDLNFTEIGLRLGITRERVRQIVRKEGVPASLSKVIRSDRNAEEFVCKYCGKTEWRAYRVRTKYCGLSCARKAGAIGIHVYTNDELLGHLRLLAVQLGRTPALSDVIKIGKPAHGTYYQRFGSFLRACELAGLPPNKRGGRRYVKHVASPY